MGLAAFVQEENEYWGNCIHLIYFSVKGREVAIRPAALTPIQWVHKNGESFRTNEQIAPKRFLVKVNRNFRNSEQHIYETTNMTRIQLLAPQLDRAEARRNVYG
jgi:hypothetical protein